MGQSEVRIELNSSIKMLNRTGAILRRYAAKDEARKQVATAQVLLISSRVLTSGFGNTHLLRGTKFEPQAFHNLLGNCVLEGDGVRSRRVDTIAPEYVARSHVEQLSGYSKVFASMNKTSGEDSVDIQLFPDLSRILVLPLISGNH